MALSTEEAAVNTATDALVAAWKALLDAYILTSPVPKIYLVGVQDDMTKGASAPTFNPNGSRKRVIDFPTDQRDFYRLADEPLKDLFFKVTNAAGE